jgi:hypothetical protein
VSLRNRAYSNAPSTGRRSLLSLPLTDDEGGSHRRLFGTGVNEMTHRPRHRSAIQSSRVPAVGIDHGAGDIGGGWTGQERVPEPMLTIPYARLRAHVLAVADATGRDTEHLGCLLANGTAELAGQDPAEADRAAGPSKPSKTLWSSASSGPSDTAPSTPPPTRAGRAGCCWPSCEASKPWGKANTGNRSLRSIAEAALDTLPRPCDREPGCQHCLIRARP